MQIKTETMEEPEYVVVARSLDEDAERIELPTEQDNTLGLQTLVGAFPGAHGLKYKNPATGAFRALLIDTSGSKFHPPADGWLNKVFVVLSRVQQQHESAVTKPKKSDQNAKRRKLMVESDTADSCDSDAESHGGGKSCPESAMMKRQQGTIKQKRMMGNSGSGTSNSNAKDKEDADAAEEELPNKMVDLLVLGLPFELTEDELRAHFETFGKVVHCEVKTQKGATSNRGFGFVQMADLDAQQKVLKHKEHQINGRECQVKIPFTKNALSSKVFVGRIKEGTTTVELRNFFTEEAQKIDPESTVTDVYIPRPFRSFAFVTFSSPAVAKAMIKQGQYTIGETPIYVSSAHSTRPQPQQNDGQLQQQQQFQQRPTNSYQQSQQRQNPAIPGYTAEMFYDWYGAPERRGDHPLPPPTGIHSAAAAAANRVMGPMFTGPPPQHHHQNPPPSLPMAYANPPAAVAGSQMLNQLETLNLNNIGIQHEVVNAIKAILSVAQNQNTSAQQPLPPPPSIMQHQQRPVNPPLIQQQHQPYAPYHHHGIGGASSSLSPPGPIAGGSSPGRYVPPPLQQQQQQQASSASASSHHHQGRRHGGGGTSNSNNNGSGAGSGGGWR